LVGLAGKVIPVDLQKRFFKIVLPAFPDLIWKVPASTDKIFLTFDDGPYPAVTEGVLEILNHYKISALFFLTGLHIEENQTQLKNLAFEAHRLGNHGFFHEPIIFKSVSRLVDEIKHTDELIQKFFNKHTIYFRPPYGIWGPQLSSALKSNPKRLILWSLLANDFKWPTERIFNHLIRGLEPGDIIVFHDSEKAGKKVLEVLPRFIDYCLQNHVDFGLL
jgi:peptidoglycan/xylan/chitin deacetylase (PgdA/CDA1 family)